MTEYQSAEDKIATLERQVALDQEAIRILQETSIAYAKRSGTILDNAIKSLERIKIAFQALRDGEEHASSNLYRTLTAEFPPQSDAKGNV